MKSIEHLAKPAAQRPLGRLIDDPEQLGRVELAAQQQVLRLAARWYTRRFGWPAMAPRRSIPSGGS
jgi:hypothetical protein